MVVGVDGLADELVVIEDADLGDVPGVVPDDDGPAHEPGERRRDVAQSLEVDPVTLDGPGAGDREQERIEVLEAVGHAR